jgi:SAM-dependent methyltransferase
MTTRPAAETVLDVNIRTRHVKALSGWRRLYLRLLEALEPESVVECGCGPADFLSQLPQKIRRVGLDGNPGYLQQYEAAGIEFHAIDFDADEFPEALTGFDTAVCSDVFEHLLYPQKLLGNVAGTLSGEGILFSHVPNEFRVAKMLPIMRGRAGSVMFHSDTEEWSNPHLRRFTDVGYRRFLGLEFEFNVPLSSLNAPKAARHLKRFGLPVPFGLQGGPTYASTNSRETFLRLEEIVAQTPPRR